MVGRLASAAFGKDPTSGEWTRTFAIITTDANSLVANIHDRMPLILAPSDYGEWLSDHPDPRELMRPFPASPMRMWAISARVNKPENDDPDIVRPLELEESVEQPDGLLGGCYVRTDLKYD
jgi:putative SOS response-associated peptidase YedK